MTSTVSYIANGTHPHSPRANPGLQNRFRRPKSGRDSVRPGQVNAAGQFSAGSYIIICCLKWRARPRLGGLDRRLAVHAGERTLQIRPSGSVAAAFR